METSEMFDNIYGVLQGGVISPSLFKLYIDDMCQYLGDSTGVTVGGTLINHLLFADDLVLMSETSIGLQCLIHKLEIYCHRWHMSLNIFKTKVMVFNEGSQICRDVANFTFEGKYIEQVDSYKYLGVIISGSQNRFKKHFSYMKDKANRAIITTNIYIRQATRGELPSHLYLKVFDQQIRPILEYASEIWCQPQPIEELERTQLKFLKKSIGVSQSTPTPAVLGETGRFPLHLRQEDSLLKLWARLNLLPSTNILYKIYTDLLQLHNEGHDTWSGRVKAIFSKYGTDDREIDGLTTPAEYHNFLQTFREIRHNRYAQNWLSTIRNNEKSTKLCTYRLIKNDYRIEPHLLYVENKKHQRALTRLRVSSHKLHIELGRHVRPPIPPTDRLCQFCNSREIDDEVHFLITCEFHGENRNSLLADISHLCCLDWNSSPQNKFECIMKSKNKSVLAAVAKFVYNGFKKRGYG